MSFDKKLIFYQQHNFGPNQIETNSMANKFIMSKI